MTYHIQKKEIPDALYYIRGFDTSGDAEPLVSAKHPFDACVVVRVVKGVAWFELAHGTMDITYMAIQQVIKDVQKLPGVKKVRWEGQYSTYKVRS